MGSETKIYRGGEASKSNCAGAAVGAASSRALFANPSFSSSFKDYTNKMRVLIGTNNRDQMQEYYELLVLGDQAGEWFTMFNTSFSYEVIDAMQNFFRMLTNTKKKEPLWKTFDRVFAFTYTIGNHSYWMSDHEVGWGRDFGGSMLVKRLAKEWKELLGHSNEELGIDGVYGRPGILCFLEQFMKDIDGIEDGKREGITFNFQ
jgi:hypothetical protein